MTDNPMTSIRKKHPFLVMGMLVFLIAGDAAGLEAKPFPAPDEILMAKSRPEPREKSSQSGIDGLERPIRDDRHITAVPEDTEASPFQHFRLIGSITGNRMEPYAIILNTLNGEQDLYRAGDTLLYGVIAEVQPGQVFLKVQSRSVTIVKEVAASPESGAPADMGDRKDRIERRVFMMRSLYDEMIAEQLPFPDEWAAPAEKTGKLKSGGVMMGRILPGSVIHFFGLAHGDVIVLINGRKIQSKADMEASLMEMAKAETTDIEFFRETSSGRIIVYWK